MGIRIKDLKDQAVYLQPPNTGQCGQYAVANLLNKLPEEIILAFKANGINNKKGGTTTKQVAKALRSLGFKCDERMKILKPETRLPNYCLIAVGWKGPKLDSGLRRDVASHWVAYKKGIVICSGSGIFNSLNEYTEQNNGYAFGYLEINK